MKTTKKWNKLSLEMLALVAAFVLVVAGCDNSNDPAPQQKPADTILEETSSVGAIKSRAPLTNEEKSAVTANINSAVNSAEFAWYKNNAGTLDIYIENGLAGSEAGLHLNLDEAKGAASAITTKAIAHFKAQDIFEPEFVVTRNNLMDVYQEKGVEVGDDELQKVVSGWNSFRMSGAYAGFQAQGIRLVVFVEDLTATAPHFKTDGLHLPLVYLADENITDNDVKDIIMEYVDSLGI
jgi:uncharacterized lipoprotein NlpE involved in copper resistance